MTNKFIEQRVEALENELSELKLIVAQIRKPSTVVEEALVNDIIEFEGKQYKKVDREAQINDVVIFRVNETDKEFSVINKPYLVSHMEGSRPRFIGKGRTKFYVYSDDHKRTPETVDVYELIVEDKPKTANQLRAEIIEKAKGFVEDVTAKMCSHQVNLEGSVIYQNKITIPEFRVNVGKRTVVALVKGRIGGQLYAKGIAKCDPSDVFNEHIGKAIALGRALGLDVSEFEQAVQPTLANGQIVYFTNEHGPNVQYSVVLINENQTLNLKITKDYEDNELVGVDAYFLNSRDDVSPTIINDTNAIYETAVSE